MPDQCAAHERPAGAGITLSDLARDPHLLLAQLRAREPVCWLPALGGWLVTRWDLAVAVLRDDVTFTVDDPRFTTARVVGPSMLSLDGAEHDRHRAPFAGGFGREMVTRRMAAFTAGEAERLVLALRPRGHADLRAGLAGPLAAGVISRALGLSDVDAATVLAWYREIVAAVSALAGQVPGTAAAGETCPAGPAGPGAGPVGSAAGPAGPGAGTGGLPAAGTAAQALGQLAACVRQALAAPPGTCLLAGVTAGGGLTPEEAVPNAAVVMFGGIETTEGMITNTLFHLLTQPRQLRLVGADRRLIPAAVEESLRLEPAAALVDRYATRDVALAGAQIRAGDLVSVSIAAAGRDPAVFERPDVFDVRRPNSRRHLAFARGPHFCLGAHLARLEAQCAVDAALRLLPGLRLDRERAAAPEGLVFRKPPALPALWETGGR